MNMRINLLSVIIEFGCCSCNKTLEIEHLIKGKKALKTVTEI